MRRWTGRLAVWAVGLAVVRFVAAPAEICGDTDPASLERAADEAIGWIDRALKDDGSYVYLYLLDERREVDDYNIVRHAGVTMSRGLTPAFVIASRQSMSCPGNSRRRRGSSDAGATMCSGSMPSTPMKLCIVL